MGPVSPVVFVRGDTRVIGAVSNIAGPMLPEQRLKAEATTSDKKTLGAWREQLTSVRL